MKVCGSIILVFSMGLARGEQVIRVGEVKMPRKVIQGVPITLSFPVEGEWESPYDTHSFFVRARVWGPNGEEMTYPCYFAKPYKVESQRKMDIRANVQSVRFEIHASDWPAGEVIQLLLDDLQLVGKRGKRKVLSPAERVAGWKGERMSIALNRRDKARGKACIQGTVKLPEKFESSVHAVVMQVTNGDWSEYDELQFQMKLESTTDNGDVHVVVDGGAHGKFTDTYTAKGGGYVPGRWCLMRLRLPRPRLKSTWARAGSDEWRLNFTPRHRGPHRIVVYAESRTRWAKSKDIVFDVEEGTPPRRVMVSPRDYRYLEYEDGTPYFPVGLNICWGDALQVVSSLRRLARNGGNFVRIWLAPWSFPIEWEKAGDYDQKAAAQLDYVMRECERLDIRVMLCLDYHGAFRESEAWSQNPYSVEKGGPCEKPEDFFTSPKAAELYRRRLDYLIARYGSSPALMAWELFNEVAHTDPYRLHKYQILDWHEKMARYLKLNDVYGHLVTTSIGGDEQWDSIVWRARDIDILQAHYYFEWESFSRATRRCIRAFRGAARPVLLSEFGLSREQSRNLDPTGIGFHNALWAATMQGAAGTPMPWWWDDYIEDFGLYRHLVGVSKFLENVDFPAEGFKPLRGWNLLFPGGHPKRYGTLVIRPDKSSFNEAPFNKPQTYVVHRDGRIEGPRERADTIHGIGDHAKLHNPQTFEVDYPVDGTFGVVITQVSNWNSSELRILVDAKEVVRKEFPDNDPGTGVQYRYNGVYRVPVKAGKHTITVDNRGRDWIKVAYVLENYREPGQGALVLYGLAGRNTMLVWVRNRENVYYARHWGIRPVPVEGATLVLKDLPAGRMRATVYDTFTGEVISERMIDHSSARIPLPPVLRDVSVKLEKP